MSSPLPGSASSGSEHRAVDGEIPSAVPGARPRCRGVVTSDGRPCGVRNGLGPSGYCVFHDPERVAQVRKAAARGRTAARARRKQVASEGEDRGLEERLRLPAPKTLEHAVEWASMLTKAIADGQISAARGREAGKLLHVFQGAYEKRELQRRIVELERALAAQRAAAP